MSKPRTIEDMAARLNVDRARFAAVYDRIRKADVPDFKTIAIQRERAPGEPEEERDRSDILAALRRADQDGWLDRFTTATLGELTDDPALIIDLQAITNPKVDFDHIGDVNLGGLKAMRRCCRVVSGDDGDAVRGSGFLIGPQLVLTNWHVVRNQIEVLAAWEAENKERKERKQPELPQPPIKVHVEFDSMRRHDRTVAPPVVEHVRQHRDHWLVASSADGLDQRLEPGTERPLPGNLETLREYIDFAVLDLTNPVGYERGWYELNGTLGEPRPETQGVLVQFPGNYAMRVTTGEYLTEPELPARICHGMNAIGGSSGGLCASTTYEPLALHQGSLRLTRRKDKVEKKTLMIGEQNLAIPLHLIKAVAGTEISARAGQASSRVYRTPTGDAIVGRDGLQHTIHESIYGENRIIVVRNNFDSENGGLKTGVGKSFTVKILEAMTRPADTLIRSVNAADLPADPYTAARALVAPFRDSTANPIFQQALAAVAMAAPHGDTTQEAEIRGLADTLFTALLSAAGDRTLWLVIDDLDRHPVVSGSATSNLLTQLYELISASSQLRAVLIGPSRELEMSDTGKLRYDGPLPNLEPFEIEQWIERARDHERPFAKDDVTMLQKMVWEMIPFWRQKDALSRTACIGHILTKIVGPLL